MSRRDLIPISVWALVATLVAANASLAALVVTSTLRLQRAQKRNREAHEELTIQLINRRRRKRAAEEHRKGFR